MRRLLLPILLCLCAIPAAAQIPGVPFEWIYPAGGETLTSGDEVALKYRHPFSSETRSSIYLRDFNDPAARWVKVKRVSNAHNLLNVPGGVKRNWFVSAGLNSNRMALLLVLESDRSQKARSNLFTITDGLGKTDMGPGAPLTEAEMADFRITSRFLWVGEKGHVGAPC